jgi:hypothetical protein
MKDIPWDKDKAIKMQQDEIGRLEGVIKQQMDHDAGVIARLKTEVSRLLTRISDQDHIIGQLTGNVEGYAMRCHQLTEEKHGAYTERDKCVSLIARIAQAMGLPAGIERHPDDDQTWDDEWRNIIRIDLPAGQVSWHIRDDELPLFSFLQPYNGEWDGHDTEEKYRRVLSCENDRIGERLRAEAASHIAMLRHSFDIVSENTSEDDPTNPLYDLVDEIDGYIATCDTAGADLLDRMRKMEKVCEATKEWLSCHTLLAQRDLAIALAELKGGE